MSKSKIFKLYNRENVHVGNEYHEQNEHGVIQIYHESLIGHWTGVPISERKLVREGFFIPHVEKLEALYSEGIQEPDLLPYLQALKSTYENQARAAVNARNWVLAESSEARAATVDYILSTVESRARIQFPESVNMILRERSDQIHKHGFTFEHDAAYKNDELLDGAMYLLTLNDEEYPKGWDVGWSYKFKKKTPAERMAVAAALIIAALDVELLNKAVDKELKSPEVGDRYTVGK